MKLNKNEYVNLDKYGMIINNNIILLIIVEK